MIVRESDRVVYQGCADPGLRDSGLRALGYMLSPAYALEI
jgi:hypothetical protein